MKKINISLGVCLQELGEICLAFKNSGCRIVWANEKDKYACKTYRLNFGDNYLVQGDIQSIVTKDIPKFDILTAGFPCQSFSLVRLLQGLNAPRANLFF